MHGDGYRAPALELRGIGKSFNGVQALSDVSFRLEQGEVVGLIGDNGAGKSTLVKILSGVHRPDSGEMYVMGLRVDPRRYSVRDARELGVETVHQERSLGERQPLWRNLFVGRHLTGRLGFIDVRRERKETLTVLREYIGLRGVGVSADASVRTLSGGERQGLAIGRAMHFRSEVIILDEPTTALSLSEVDKVLSFVRRIKAEGRSCIFISHTMRHVHEVCDRFVVMDRGRIACERTRMDTSLDGLTTLLTNLAICPAS